MSSAARNLVPIDLIVEGLASRIVQLVVLLLPHGTRAGHEWVCSGNHFGTGQSMAVHLGGAKAGVWQNFIAGVGGDALDLVAYVMFNGDKKQAYAWARNWLGYGGAAPTVEERRQAEQAGETRRRHAEEQAERRRRAAHRLWLGAQAQIAGTPAEYYLAGRGIDLASLGRQPGAIRFHPAVFCTEVDRYLPAMVTAVCSDAVPFMGCHRTYLEQAGPGDWRKARLEKPKKVLGQFTGGMIRLWKGASGREMARAPVGETVHVTEGIEDGLSVVMAMPAARVVAAISLSNMGNLTFPPAIAAVQLWRQNDTAREAIEAFDRVQREFLRRGLKVIVPPIPEGVKDVNELLNAGME